MLSFITPYRNRPEQLEGFLLNIEEFFKDYEVIVCSQDDDRPFARGQLFNLGFQKCSGDIIVLQDTDLRWLEKIEVQTILGSHKSPILPYTYIAQAEEPSPGTIRIKEIAPRDNCGGVCFMTRDDFIKSNGFSNLMVGWGGEDNLFNERAGLLRIQNTIAHIEHDTHKGDEALVWARYLKNMDLWRSDRLRNRSVDSYRETCATELGMEEVNGRSNIKMFHFKDIRVTDDFEYKDLLDGRESMSIDEIKASMQFPPYYNFLEKK